MPLCKVYSISIETVIASSPIGDENAKDYDDDF